MNKIEIGELSMSVGHVDLNILCYDDSAVQFNSCISCVFQVANSCADLGENSNTQTRCCSLRMQILSVDKRLGASDLGLTKPWNKFYQTKDHFYSR